MPNLLAGKEIVKELLQEDCQPDKLAQQLLPLLEGGERVENLKETLQLHQLIRCDADKQAAEAVLDMVKN